MAAQVIDAEEEKTPHLKFLQQGSPVLIDPTSFIKDVDPTAKLLSVSSKYGFAIAGVFAGTSLAFFKLSDVPHKGPIPPEKIFKFDCKTQPYHISLSPDGLTLAVILKNSQKLLIFSAAQLDQKIGTPLATVTVGTNDAAILEVSWSQSSDALLALTASGQVFRISYAHNWSTASTPITTDSQYVSLSWNSASNQILCGLKDCSVSLLSGNSGQVIRTIQRPEFIEDAEYWAHHVEFLPDGFAAVGFRSNANDEDRPRFTILDLTTAIYRKFFVGTPQERRNAYHVVPLPEWKLVIVAGSSFPEVEILVRAGEDREWRAAVPAGDNYRAAAPLDAQDKETHVLGIALDFTSTESISEADRTLPPSPILTILTDAGVLCRYAVVHEKAPTPYPFMVTAVQPLPAALAPAAVPAAKPAAALAAAAAASTASSGQSSTSPSTPLFKPPATTGGFSFGSGFGFPAPADSKSAASAPGGGISLTGSTTITGGGSSAFSGFGAPTLSTGVSTSTAPALPGGSATSAFGMLSKPAATTAATTSSTTAAATTTGGASLSSGFSMPSTGGGFFGSFGTPGATNTTPTPTVPTTAPTPPTTMKNVTATATTSTTATTPSLATAFGSLPTGGVFAAKPAAPTALPASAEPTSLTSTVGLGSFAMPALVKKPDAVAPVQAQATAPAPASSTTTAASPAIQAPALQPAAPATAAPQAEVKPAAPAATGKQSIIPQSPSPDEIEAQLHKLISRFEENLTKVKQSTDATAVKLKAIDANELSRMQELAQKCERRANALSDAYVKQQAATYEVTKQYIQAMGQLEDARSLLEAKLDPEYQTLVNSRKLDAESLSVRAYIRQTTAEAELHLGELDRHLDQIWAAEQTAAAVRQRAKTPTIATLFSTLTSHYDIAANQTLRVEELRRRVRDLQLTTGRRARRSSTASPYSGSGSTAAMEEPFQMSASSPLAEQQQQRDPVTAAQRLAALKPLLAQHSPPASLVVQKARAAAAAPSSSSASRSAQPPSSAAVGALRKEEAPSSPLTTAASPAAAAAKGSPLLPPLPASPIKPAAVVSSPQFKFEQQPSPQVKPFSAASSTFTASPLTASPLSQAHARVPEEDEEEEEDEGDEGEGDTDEDEGAAPSRPAPSATTPPTAPAAAASTPPAPSWTQPASAAGPLNKPLVGSADKSPDDWKKVTLGGTALPTTASAALGSLVKPAAAVGAPLAAVPAAASGPAPFSFNFPAGAAFSAAPTTSTPSASAPAAPAAATSSASTVSTAAVSPPTAAAAPKDGKPAAAIVNAPLSFGTAFGGAFGGAAALPAFGAALAPTTAAASSTSTAAPSTAAPAAPSTGTSGKAPAIPSFGAPPTTSAFNVDFGKPVGAAPEAKPAAPLATGPSGAPAATTEAKPAAAGSLFSGFSVPAFSSKPAEVTPAAPATPSLFGAPAAAGAGTTSTPTTAGGFGAPAVIGAGTTSTPATASGFGAPTIGTGTTASAAAAAAAPTSAFGATGLTGSGLFGSGGTASLIKPAAPSSGTAAPSSSVFASLSNVGVQPWAATAAAPAALATGGGDGMSFGGFGGLGASQPLKPAGNPFGAAPPLGSTPTTASSAPPTSGPFGATSSGFGTFGAQASAGAAATPSPFGTPAAGSFGATSAAPAPAFGSSAFGGGAAAATPSPFGAAFGATPAGTTPFSSAVASPAPAAPAFGAPAAGGPSPWSTIGGFGASSTLGMGAPSPFGSSAFGAGSPLGGAPAQPLAGVAKPFGGAATTFQGFGAAPSAVQRPALSGDQWLKPREPQK